MRNKIISLILGVYIFSATGLQAQVYQETMKFSQFIQYLDNYYVDSVDIHKLLEEAIKTQLNELDPHSTYISKEDVKKMTEPLQGNFEGVGISFNILNDTLYVISAIPGGPSEKVGILAGDRIIKVEHEIIAGVGLTNERVFDLLRGPKGTIVTVSIRRRGVNELLEFTITRDKIPIYSKDASYMIDNTTAYIKLNRFARTTLTEFLEAVVELKKEGAEDLILDLTGNAGGYLDMAISLADQFIDNNKLIVYTEGLKSERHEYKASNAGTFEKGRIVILIDEGSASASEIVSGAIQDWDRGVIVGRRSFGKGLVQRQMDLMDGSMIRLTTARYYTPSGRLIQKPYDDGIDAYHRDISERYNNGEFLHPDSIDFPDSLQYKTLISGRTVFGGGGIMPDIFVPLDTNSYSNYYRDLVRKGTLNQFVLQHVDKKRNKLEKEYKSFDQYKDGFVVTNDLFDELLNYAKDNKLPPDSADIETSKQKISLLLKAYIARDLWTSSEFYEIVNQENQNVLKALEVLKDWDRYAGKFVQ